MDSENTWSPIRTNRRAFCAVDKHPLFRRTQPLQGRIETTAQRLVQCAARIVAAACLGRIRFDRGAQASRLRWQRRLHANQPCSVQLVGR